MRRSSRGKCSNLVKKRLEDAHKQGSEAGEASSDASFPALRRAHDHKSTYTKMVLFVYFVSRDETSNEVAVEVPEIDSFKAMPSQRSANAAQADGYPVVTEHIHMNIYTYKRVVCICLFVCLLFIGHTAFVHFAALPPKQSMYWTNITNIVGESTHIVNRIKSLTVPCGCRLMLIFFSSGRCFSCCLLGTGTACSPETAGFSPGCS